ncbi:MAG: glucosylceramidase [Polyangiaceae bacterium]|nr:glucosylceramidase [Polyangiaceae bacterium]
MKRRLLLLGLGGIGLVVATACAPVLGIDKVERWDGNDVAGAPARGGAKATDIGGAAGATEDGGGEAAAGTAGGAADAGARAVGGRAGSGTTTGGVGGVAAGGIGAVGPESGGDAGGPSAGGGGSGGHGVGGGGDGGGGDGGGGDGGGGDGGTSGGVGGGGTGGGGPTGGTPTGGAPTGGGPSGGAGTGGAETGGQGTGGSEPEPELITSADGNWWQEGTVTKSTGNGSITVDPNTTYQTWIGFGGTFNERGWQAMQGLSAADRQLAIRLLFSKTEGAGFALGRIPMGASDYAVEHYCYADTANDYTMSNFTIAQDRQMLIPYIKAALAVKPDLYLWASPWTPPPWMKSNNAYNKGWMKSDAQTLAAYALYFSKFIDAYAGEGLTVRAVCPHNEPGWEQGYPSCLWDVDTYVKFVGTYLGPQFATDHPEVLIWLGAMSRTSAGTALDNQAIPGDPAIVTGVMNNATARGYIDGIGLQWEMMSQNYGSYDLPLHATEHKCGNYPWSPAGYPAYNSQRAPNDFAYGLESWGYIKDWIVSKNGNSYSAWNMVLDPLGLGNDTERDWKQNALLVADGPQLNRTPAYYVFRHSSQFVDPDAVRIQTSAQDGFAFKNPDGDIVLVMHTTSGGQTSVGIEGTTLTFTAPANGWVTLNYRPTAG